MVSALGPVDVLCRQFTTLYFSLSSFLCITVIWSPLSNCMTCMLRRMESTVAMDLELENLTLMTVKSVVHLRFAFAHGGVLVYIFQAAASRQQIPLMTW